MKRLKFILILSMVHGVVFATSAPLPTSGKTVSRTPMGKLQLKLRHQMAQIQLETRRGKLTTAQSKALKVQVVAVQKQEVTDIKQNGNKTLTGTQIAQLDQQLNSISKSIPVK